MLNVGQGQPAQSLAQGDAQRCANSLGLDTMNGSTAQSSVGRGKVGTFVGHFVANSTYFNHVNLLRKHLLCFLHTITTTGNCRRRRLPQTKWGKGSGCSAFSLSLWFSARLQRYKFQFQSFYSQSMQTRALLHSLPTAATGCKVALYSPVIFIMDLPIWWTIFINAARPGSECWRVGVVHGAARQAGRLKKRVVSHFSADSLLLLSVQHRWNVWMFMCVCVCMCMYVMRCVPSDPLGQMGFWLFDL